MSQTVSIPQSIKDSLRKFRFAKRTSGNGHAAIVIKINKKTLEMEEDERYDSISLEELAEELPENSPRYVVVSYELKFSDGRISYPLILISWAPESAEIGMKTLHATALQNFQNTVDVQKTIEVREDPEEQMTGKYFDSQLQSKY